MMSTQMECSTESTVGDGAVPGVDSMPGLAPSPFCSACIPPLGVVIGGGCATCSAEPGWGRFQHMWWVSACSLLVASLSGVALLTP